MEKIKVLLVDDEEDFVTTLAERIKMRDLEGDVALNGEQALKRIEDDTPDVMVLDLRMPGIDGMEVLRRVRKAYPRVEVVILTGHGSEKDEQEAKDLGAFAYLQKPVELDELMQVVGKAYKKVQEYKTAMEDQMVAATLAEAGIYEPDRTKKK